MGNKYQEALNNYVYLLQQFSQFELKDIARKCNIDLIKNRETLQELIDNYSKLEKALNKACEKLFFARVFDGMTPKNIKKYLLKESEKQ